MDLEIFELSTLIKKLISDMMPHRNKTFMVYIFILLIITVACSSLPFLSTTISIKSSGIIRPTSERAQIRATQSGIIDTIFFREGDFISELAILLKVNDNVTAPRVSYNKDERNRLNQFARDLRLLTNSSSLSDASSNGLSTALYKEQLNQYLNRLAEQTAILEKADKEYNLHNRLWKEKVISDKEYFDYQNAQQRVHANYEAFIREQKSRWFQQLSEYDARLNQLTQERRLTDENAKTYEVRTPVAGVIQGMEAVYKGGAVQAGDVICSVSPESGLIGESYVSPKDIGLLKVGQNVIYQIDAFDYNLFGTMGGKIINIDNDFILIENRPVFKVRCSFNSETLALKNGFAGQLKKGLIFQARFVIGKRTLWQLLWDRMDDWLNPVAPPKYES